MKSYAVMHLERQVATLRGDGSCTVYAPSFMPYNLYLEKTDGTGMSARLNNLNSFHYWCASRLLTLDRKYAKEILNSLGMRQAVTDQERAEIAISYHALCLTDVFWVRELGEKIRYADINLYDHSLSDAFVDVSLCGRVLTAENAELLRPADSAGDLSTLGVAPKAWIRRDGGFWLLKDGEPGEVEAELAASQIARCFDVEQVLYEPWDYEGQRLSRSRLITSRERSIVPAEYVDVYAANHGKSLRDLIRAHDIRGYHMMNIIDYLVGNTDRHWGNWGFWINNANNKLEKLHPLMDFNRSFRAYDTLEGAKCLTTEENVSQMEAALRGVKAVGFRPILELPNNLPLFFREQDGMYRRRVELLRQADEEA